MSERGSILPLIAGALFLTLAIVFGVSASSSLLIERSRLFTLADGAAVAAAQGFSPRNVTRSTGGALVFMTDADARRVATEYLQRVGPGRLRDLRLDLVTMSGSDVVEVQLSSLWSPPIVSDYFPVSLRIDVSAQAQTLIR